MIKNNKLCAVSAAALSLTMLSAAIPCFADDSVTYSSTTTYATTDYPMEQAEAAIVTSMQETGLPDLSKWNLYIDTDSVTFDTYDTSSRQYTTMTVKENGQVVYEGLIAVKNTSDKKGSSSDSSDTVSSSTEDGTVSGKDSSSSSSSAAGDSTKYGKKPGKDKTSKKKYTSGQKYSSSAVSNKGTSSSTDAGTAGGTDASSVETGKEAVATAAAFQPMAYVSAIAASLAAGFGLIRKNRK